MQKLLPPSRLDRAGYLDRDGYLAYQYAVADTEWARKVLTSTPLTGLGGAHFAFARKVASMLTSSTPRVVVCNAAEDEPGSRKDRMLLARNPHVVLEGAMIAAIAVDATDIVIYVSELADEEHQSLTEAMAEIDDPPATAAIRIVRADQRYVSGEATAAVDAINGGDGKPTGQPPYPTEKGVNGRPTLVANCETLANLPRIVRADRAGLEPSWTRLTTVTGDIAAPGVYEIDPYCDTFADLFVCAGNVTGSGRLKGFQPGGPSSRFLGPDAAGTLIANDAIRAAGSQPGCLAIRVVSTSSCIVEICREITAFFSREQCGQCPPCRMKTQTYHRIMQQVGAAGGGWDLLEKLAAVEEFVGDMPRRCSLIDMPTPPVESALTLFPDDFAAHIEGGSCAQREASAVSPS
ncbi:NADH-ubiquinone oxidoreductase-F iron-sulfur binding region domain-containing protein [Mycolicibacterium agri]|nr:NADH-ubiquinone oxidoreductase-F iron-sulfur binding region domain-containing protein [Mycolicibacterium agri]GFG52450.1 NADH-quinone oxidoreductase subunit F [Mycolicibacterium agri]